MTEQTPRRIEWSGPEGWLVWTDEDGTHVRSPKGDALEMPSFKALMATWKLAQDSAVTGSVPAPKPPTREELRAMSHDRAEEYAKRRVVRAIEAEFNPPAQAPF